MIPFLIIFHRRRPLEILQVLGISDVADLHFTIRKLRDDIGIIISSEAEIISVPRKEFRHWTLRLVLVHRQERHHRFPRSEDQTDSKQCRHRKSVKGHFFLFQIKTQYRQGENEDRDIIPRHHGTGGKNKHKQIQYKTDFQKQCDQTAKSRDTLHFPAFDRNVSVDAKHHKGCHRHNTPQG